MKTNIKHIYKQNIRLIGEADKSIYYFRQQQFDKAGEELAKACYFNGGRGIHHSLPVVLEC